MDVGNSSSSRDIDGISSTNSNSGNTNLAMQLELTDELKQQEIVSGYTFDPETDNLSIALNHKYSDKKITSPIQSTWPKTIATLTKELKRKKIKSEHIIMLCDVADNAAVKILTRRKNNNADINDDKHHQKRKPIFIRKYTCNGTLPLYESVVIAGLSSFLHLGEDYRPQYTSTIEISNKIFYPTDTSDTQNPLPYIFASAEELQGYLNLASEETFEALLPKVEAVYKKYVSAEEYYIVILAADTICSYFQDRFGTTHYNIFVGDNGSGKNSALLVYRYLAYRVFYVTAASAANYYTFLGETEEGQGTTAEDEADDIGYNRHKQKIFKTGYCSGGFVPKVELPNGGGRRQDSWLTYCHKWMAMESLPDQKKIKGILDTSLVYNFVASDVPYNIKDIIRYAGDPKVKPLYDELVHLRKLLFAFRMIDYNDIIPDIKLNIIHRNAELTKPLLRLFSYQHHSPTALERIRCALSNFIEKRNDLKRNSIESKLRDAINNLVEERKKNPDPEKFKGLEEYSFYNEDIFVEVTRVTNGSNVPLKPASFYSVEYGLLSHKAITGLYRSKFNAERFKIGSGNETRRGLRFSKDVLDKLGAYYYDVPDVIEIIKPSETESQSGHDNNNEDNGANSTQKPTSESIQQSATVATDATHCKVGEGVNVGISKGQYSNNNENISVDSPDSSKSYNVLPNQPVLDSRRLA